jgi:hypothetical protein
MVKGRAHMVVIRYTVYLTSHTTRHLMTLKRYRGEYGVVKYSDCVNGVAP